MRNQQKILLIDDEPDVLEFLSYNFRKKGFDVVTAKNGVEGINQAEKELPQLIISDIMMPELDGVEMCKTLREKEATKDTPFIFLTALSDEYKMLYAMLSGGDEFITKPTPFKYLLSVSNRLLLGD